MKTWNDYKEYASEQSPEVKADIEEASQLATFVTLIIQRRNELGLTQRELAALSGLPQSSIARMETMKTVPSIDTVLKIVKPLGLQLSLLPISA
ncbi:MAG: helix-turn-helix transcriptional regulator [Eubacteriales bacterium]|jgi:DNA-binding XRE family transcriptional regulator|nr:helix-turn-helix transcriptional regulator [Eubacteriales bacterium]